MEYIKLGKTGFKVSKICFGALTIGPLQAKMSVEEGASIIRYALEQGINFIDTAKLYGTYPYIRKALKGWDKKVYVSSKSYDYTWEGMKKSLEQARIDLDRDYIDIFMLHEQESELTLQGHKPALEYLEEAKAKGLVKAIGVSTHTVEVVRVAAERDDIEVIHPIINYQGLGILDGTITQLMVAVKRAHAQGKGLYGMKPLGGGNLITDVKKALNYAFQIPYLHSVAIGCKSKEELDFNICIMEGKEPPQKLSQKVQAVPRKLHIEEWCRGCGACVKRCPNGFLELHEGKARLKNDECILCGYCGAVCPEFAIKII